MAIVSVPLSFSSGFLPAVFFFPPPSPFPSSRHALSPRQPLFHNCEQTFVSYKIMNSPKVKTHHEDINAQEKFVYFWGEIIHTFFYDRLVQ